MSSPGHRHRSCDIGNSYRKSKLPEVVWTWKFHHPSPDREVPHGLLIFLGDINLVGKVVPNGEVSVPEESGSRGCVATFPYVSCSPRKVVMWVRCMLS